MKGDRHSIDNVKEVGRLLRLEKMRNDFYAVLFKIAAFLLVLVTCYIYLVFSKASHSESSRPSMLSNVYACISVFFFTNEEYFTKAFYGTMVAISLWLVVGMVSWAMTKRESLLTEGQLKHLGLNRLQLHTIPSKSPVRPPAVYNSRVQSSSDVSALPSPAPPATEAQQVIAFLKTPPPVRSLLDQFSATSPTPASGSTPQWLQYHSSPLSKTDAALLTAVPSLADELSNLGRLFDGFQALSISPMSITDDHKDALKKYLIRYMQDTVKRFDFVSERLADALIASGKLTPLGVDKPRALRIMSLQEYKADELNELLIMCKDTFMVQTYNRPQQTIDLLAEYLSMLQLFDRPQHSHSTVKSINLDALQPMEMRQYCGSPRDFDSNGAKDSAESDILLRAFFHLLDTKMLTPNDAELRLYGFFRLVDSTRTHTRFSADRFADGVAALPRFSAQSPPHQFHSPLRGIVNVANIVSKAGIQVGILSQKLRQPLRTNQTDLPHLSLFIPPGTGHPFLTLLTIEKGRQNCMTALILFLLVYYQSSTYMDHNVIVSNSILSAVTRLLAETFRVTELGSLKRILSEFGMPPSR